MTTPAQPAPARAPRSLPLVVFFEADAACRGVLANVPRYRRLSFESVNGEPHRTPMVVVTTSEQLIADHYRDLRAPHVRILALSETRFRDPRVDGAVYAYAPPETPSALLERLVDNALDHIQLLHSRQEISHRLAGATSEIQELNRIGAALSAEHDTGKLLELILTKSRAITRSDAGSLYLVESVEPEPSSPRGRELDAEPRRRLRFKLAQNDTVSIPFRERVMEISLDSIAGYVALTGDPVNLEDAYRLPPHVPYGINRKFDEDSGYRSKSILAVPMRNQKGETVGVVQLINAKRDAGARLDSIEAVLAQVVPYTARQQELVTSLASQAAVAYENSRLYQDIQRLFEGFVRAAVIAIEARDPTTSGHSFRVADYTVALAEAVDRLSTGPYAPVSFSRDEMKEIRYASLLHDFGKVGVREEVLVKAKKLYPAQLDLIRQRFQFVKRSMQVESLQSRLDYVLQKGREEFLARQGIFDQELAAQLAEVDGYFATILRANEPTVLPGGGFEQLLEIAARHYSDFDGQERALLSADEVRLLSIRKGSLDDAERRQIESHVVHTYNFLEQIPWTREIRNIPQIARGHHEKLNGRGYPYKLSAPEIPVQTRMMTISDIYDALTASDRPYKKAVSTEQALEILNFARQDGEIDPDLFQVFLEARVWEKSNL